MKFRPFIRIFASLSVVLALQIPVAWASDAVAQVAARPSPAWLRDGTIYEVFPRDFSQAGNLAGVTAKLDQLHDLGVNILWIMPIQPIGKKFRKGDYGSPYSICNYYAVNPKYGTLADFKALVNGAHQRGMKVIMDIVANHTAWDNVMMTNRSFYKQNAQGKIISPMPSWSDVAALNYNNPQLRKYMIKMLEYWVKTADVDGFRCDVAYMVPTSFWNEARAALTKIKPDIIMLAEASKPQLLTNAFNIDYSWPLLSTMNQVIENGAPASEIHQTWEKTSREFPKDALHMRISDDHDEARAVARYGIHGALAASALMFTLDGVPLLYNGMEVGDATESGDPALFTKLTIFWQPKGRPPLRQIYHNLIELRRHNPALCNHQVEWLHNSDERDVVSFMRGNGKEQFLVLVNFSNRPVNGHVEAKDVNGFRAVKMPGMQDFNGSSLPAFHLDSFGWHIYRRVTTAVAAK